MVEYNIFKLNERFGDKTTFIGNIAPQMLATGTKEEIENYSKKLIRELAPGGDLFLPVVTVLILQFL